YLLTAALVCYLAWPYLWFYGFEGFLRSLSEFSAFEWTGIVLFEGQVFTEATLPDYFLFKLIPLQFTLPLVLLALGGMVAAIVNGFRRKLDWGKVVLLFAWFVLPLAFTYLTGSTNYDNFRQYLFVMVPLFVFAGVALEELLGVIPWRAGRAALVILVLLPGVVGLVRLHPYQYIYYNQLAGGTNGAFREYELDYWLTSYKEAAAYIDEHIPPGSSILVWGGGRRVEPYLLNAYAFESAMRLDPSEFDRFEYVVITSEYKLDLDYHTDAETLFQVERAGVPLVFVKRLSP
ncbi:MAG TPA: hypothetical protein VJ965_12135, partial [Anaerolineales bacterium]|nr:hypothetical protein [Anaerolineales bacterium]